MTREFIERVRRDYDALDWDSYLAGYWAALGGKK